MLKMKDHDAYWMTDCKDFRVDEMLDNGYIIIAQFNTGGISDICIIARDNLSNKEYWQILRECEVQFPFNQLVNCIGLTDFCY